MAFKNEVLLYPCQLKAPRDAVFFVWLEANVLLVKTIAHHVSTQYGMLTFSD